MEPIKLITNRKISDFLVERKDGSLYDTYYKSLENLIHIYVDELVSDIINNSFIATADATGLKRWEAFYTNKPFDMNINDFRNLLFILNQLAIEGPTENNVLKLIQFFDPSGLFYPINGKPIYNEFPIYRKVNFISTGNASQTIDTDIDWVDNNFNTTNNSHILVYENSVSYIRYNESIDTYTVTMSNNSNKLRISITWVTTPPSSGLTCYILFNDLQTDSIGPFSELWDFNTGSVPTPEMILYDEDSSIIHSNEFTLIDTDYLLYETSGLNVPKLTHRILLKELLDMLLPANVRFILNFKTVNSILFGSED